MQQLQVEANEYSYSAAISAAEKGLGGSENVEIPQGLKIDPRKLEMYFGHFLTNKFICLKLSTNQDWGDLLFFFNNTHGEIDQPNW
jgi:hypothetical protein